MAVSVSGLFLHLVKSCRARAVERARFDGHGLVGDRRLLVVDAEARFLTQRDTPRLALLEATTQDGLLVLSAPGLPVLRVPFPENADQRLSVTIWRDEVPALDFGMAASDWLTLFLGRPARLVGMPQDFPRPIRKAAAQPGDHVSFADACPLLVIGEASLADLNTRLEEALPMERFRPNVVVRGAPAYAEDGWKRIRIGGVVLRAAGPCTRCVVTTTDQHTLERSKEPLATLARYRRGPAGEVWFGQNYINESKVGTIELGATVEILE